MKSRPLSVGLYSKLYGRLWNGDRWSIAVQRWLYSVISDLQSFWRIGLVAMLHRSYVRVCSLLTSCWPTIVSCQNSCQFSVKKCIPVDISVISLGFLPSGINRFLAVDFWRSSKLYPTFINVYRLDNLQRIATKLLSKIIENLWSFFFVGVRLNLPLYAPSSCGHGYSSRRTIYVELLWPTYVELLRLLIGNLCGQTWWHHHMHENLKLKKATTIKPSTQIKFGVHHYLSYDNIFKTRSRLSMFAWYFLNIFLKTK